MNEINDNIDKFERVDEKKEEPALSQDEIENQRDLTLEFRKLMQRFVNKKYKVIEKKNGKWTGYGDLETDSQKKFLKRIAELVSKLVRRKVQIIDDFDWRETFTPMYQNHPKAYESLYNRPAFKGKHIIPHKDTLNTHIRVKELSIRLTSIKQMEDVLAGTKKWESLTQKIGEIPLLPRIYLVVWVY